MTTLCEIIVAQLIMFHRRAQGHTIYQATAETLERGTGIAVVAVLPSSG